MTLDQVTIEAGPFDWIYLHCGICRSIVNLPSHATLQEAVLLATNHICAPVLAPMCDTEPGETL